MHESTRTNPFGSRATQLAAVVLGILLGHAGAASATQVAGETARFAWAPASGPVAGYVVYAARNGAPIPAVPEAFTNSADHDVELNANVGDTLRIQVAAYSADGNVGPRSAISAEVEFVPAALAGRTPPHSGGSGVVLAGGHSASGAFVHVYRLDGSLAGTFDVNVPAGVSTQALADVRGAHCDIDGDGTSELVVSFGPGSDGHLEIREGEAGGFQLLIEGYVTAGWYNQVNGEVFVDCGDVDGDGREELITGYGPGGRGQMRVYNQLEYGGSSGFVVVMVSNWTQYADADGTMIPAAGDFDGDGRDEIAAGLGALGEGRVQIFEDAFASYQPVGPLFGSEGWLQTPWASYNASVGETRPAAGDFDGDGRDEIAVGLGRGGRSAVYVFERNPQSGGFEASALTPRADGHVPTVNWLAYNLTDGSLSLVASDVDGDGREEIVALTSPSGNNSVHVIDDAVAAFSSSTQFDEAGWSIFPHWETAEFVSAAR